MSDSSSWGGGYAPPPQPPPSSPTPWGGGPNPGPPPPPPPPPPSYGGGYHFQQGPPPVLHRPPRRWPFVVGVLVVTAAVAVGTMLWARDDKYPDEWDARVADLVEYVEDERGLTFEHPVEIDFLTDEEYAAETRLDESDLPTDAADAMEQQLGWLRALGLASGDLDLLESQNDMADSGTLAYYLPHVERVIVRGTEMTVNLRVTLVHELTHVLQDQHFDLERDLNPAGAENDLSSADADRSNAFRALVEGDAMRIESGYLRTLSTSEQDEYFSQYGEDVTESEAALSEVPAALQAGQMWPYALGMPLAELLAADGGNEAVDDALRDPPSTTEHVLDPRSFLDDDEPTGIEAPDLPGSVDDETDHGPFGSVDVFFVLAERIDPLVALDAAEGWGDGLWVSYEDDDRTCARVTLDGDTADDDAQLRTGFEEWVAAAPTEAAATITDMGDGRFLLETCDPGPDADENADRALDVMNLPIARSQLMMAAVQGGQSPDDAWESGECFVRELTLEQLMAGNESSELTPDVEAALSTCGVPGF